MGASYIDQVLLLKHRGKLSCFSELDMITIFGMKGEEGDRSHPVNRFNKGPPRIITFFSNLFFCFESLLKLHFLRLLEGALPLVIPVSHQIIVVSHEVIARAVWDSAYVLAASS